MLVGLGISEILPINFRSDGEDQTHYRSFYHFGTYTPGIDRV